LSAPLGTLGRYRLTRRLAAGGMGEVYLAELPGVANRNLANLSQRVAIKRILPHLARDSDFVEKFIDEAYIMMRLHHGNIVGVHELADHDGELYIVMEYLPGRDLKAVTRRLRQRREVMPPDLALWLVAEICAALDYAHRKVDEDGTAMHIVHRDVSPSNVLLGAAGEVKLLDFGIARARGRLHQSISGTLQGKFVYMSPEQADGRKVDARSDIFSAGLVLYELITGVRPFEGESETETLRKVREGAVQPPSQIRPELEPAFDTLIMRALARDPDDRYPTADAMRRDLHHHLADTRSHAGAQPLGDWLTTLFPEGVTSPHGPSGPMSLEDALEMQLGALTPNIDPMTRTHTADLSTPSARRLLSFAGLDATPTPGLGLPAALVSGPTPIVATDPAMAAHVTDPSFRAQAITGRKRSFVLAVLLGALISTAALLWWLNQPVATVEPIVEGPSVFSVRRGAQGSEILPGVELPVGESIELCVAADGYMTQCRPFTLADGVNSPRFLMQAQPQVRLVVTPDDIDVRFTIDGAPREAGRHVVLGEAAVEICVVAAPAGWRMPNGASRCAQVKAEAGRVTPFERAFERIPDAAPTPPPKYAGVAHASDAAPATASPAPKPRQHFARHQVTIKPAGATLRCGDQRWADFPATIKTAQTLSCTAQLKGHAPQMIELSGRRSGPKTVTLEAFGRLKFRAAPGAAKVYVNGKLTRDVITRKPLLVPAGKVLVVARFTEDGTVYEDRKTVTLAPGKEKFVQLCVQTPNFKCK
jgi:serine/threonine protein kinase